MGPRVLLAGNVLSIVTTIAAFLQLVTWPVAGLLVFTLLTATSLLYGNRRKVHVPSFQVPLRRLIQNIPQASPTPRTHAPTLEPRPQPRAPAPQQPTRQLTLPAPPQPKPQAQTKPEQAPDLTPTLIERGDYLSFDVDLDEGKELIGEVSANGTVNVYVLTDETLTSLDAGEEFWSETGEEGVEKATVRFTPSEKGTWFLVVENVDDKDVSAIVTVHVNPASQPRVSAR